MGWYCHGLGLFCCIIAIIVETINSELCKQRPNENVRASIHELNLRRKWVMQQDYDLVLKKDRLNKNKIIVVYWLKLNLYEHIISNPIISHCSVVYRGVGHNYSKPTCRTDQQLPETSIFNTCVFGYICAGQYYWAYKRSCIIVIGLNGKLP